ncbi:asparaginase [Limimaricola pyoseonensis]|uniref:L-asparaginase II n=1 Tax=Limimaricola pyoseonensis TaxID=521013 RepID=A0A1G7EE92_9RHOB|nr:asparaginase [Limimaricola pyoseonensis]SDE62008.1 L-asparaginase II [Limimaricola pyoseonensis]
MDGTEQLHEAQSPASPASQDAVLVEVTRGGRVESVHRGHAVVCDASGRVVWSLGDPGAVIYPRSSCKMIQALPLIESGAADAAGLGPQELALACASHQGAAIHSDPISRWLAAQGLSDEDYRCGPETPRDIPTRDALIRAHGAARQIHNNCSGKHAGFLTLNRHIGGGPDYEAPDHPVQQAIRQAFEEVTGEPSPFYGIDGCAAPNFATTMTGLARAMARFAAARPEGSTREKAMVRLREAMAAHPELVAGEGRACTELMRAMDGVAIKTGAEGVFTAILPGQQLGVAVKITDGTTRASECAIAAILVRLGVLDPAAPAAVKRMTPVLTNRRGMEVGAIRPAAALLG